MIQTGPELSRTLLVFVDVVANGAVFAKQVLPGENGGLMFPRRRAFVGGHHGACAGEKQQRLHVRSNSVTLAAPACRRESVTTAAWPAWQEMRSRMRPA